ncbi:hypothetical protein SAMN05443247_06522 [Bradyrhizobium erythrophlei]|nr:hypothetical protein SAMN05443247_06522 [Bradyrhizobium erythrophlei]
MNTADLTTAIANLEAKKQSLAQRADAINAEIQIIAATMRETGERQNAIVAEQSAIQNAIDIAQIMLFVAGTINESRKADIRIVKNPINCV